MEFLNRVGDIKNHFRTSDYRKSWDETAKPKIRQAAKEKQVLAAPCGESGESACSDRPSLEQGHFETGAYDYIAFLPSLLICRWGIPDMLPTVLPWFSAHSSKKPHSGAPRVRMFDVLTKHKQNQLPTTSKAIVGPPGSCGARTVEPTRPSFSVSTTFKVFNREVRSSNPVWVIGFSF